MKPTYHAPAFRAYRSLFGLRHVEPGPWAPAVGVLFLALLGASNLPAAGGASSKQLLKTNSTWNGAPIHYTAASQPEVQAVVVEIGVGASTAWHRHPVNNFAYVLSGQLRVELASKESREFKAGEAFAEVVNTWHRGTNTGTTPVRILVFYAGEEGVPISVTWSPPDAGSD